MNGRACWKPGCRRDATITLAGDDWTLTTCRGHEAVARYVTGTQTARGRSGQLELALALDSEAV